MDHLILLYPTNLIFYYSIISLVPFFFLPLFLYAAPSVIKRLQNEKLRHHCAVELVTHICRQTSDRPGGSLLQNQLGELSTLKNAASFGIIEIVKILLHFCPDLRCMPLGNDSPSLLVVAIRHRQEAIFNLFCKKNARHRDAASEIRNETILHAVAKLAPFPQLSSISGAALQMQKELQWFKVTRN